MTTYRVCCCFRRKFRPASDEPPEGIRDLFRRYSGESGLMGVEQMERFLTEVQREKGDVRAMAQGIVEGSWEFKHLNLFKKGALTLDAFFRYLSGDGNPPFLSGVHHDMTAPLSHYFIYTGHNSYLTGNQLSSDCSDVPIIKALRNGVRVIELDMWPNSTNDDVNIYHGRTATTPVGLLKCLTSIREHAFFASPYPVIITLEDHLTAHLQTKVAEMIRQTFGDMLFVPDSEFLGEFPSPEGLKMKIVISTKPPKEYLEAKVTSRKDDQDLQQVKDEEGAWGNELREFEGGLNVDIEDGDDKEEHLEDEDDMDDGDHKSHQNIATQYKRLIGIPARKAKGAFTESFKVDPKKVGRLSLSEQVLEKAIISHGSEIVRFTQRNLLRIYPKGTRITSSNYNPMIGWMHGAQMVAFNMQGHGRPLWLMHGMFRANGGCGYVKKPDILVKPNGIFNPRANLQIKTIFKVRVYMGDGWRYDFSHRHFDTYSPPDFYTKIGIAGVPADTIMMKTRVIEDNWVPVWDEEFVFSLRVPELALLRIEVHEYDMNERDDFAGQTCLPLSELRVGIRAVPLFTRKGEKLPSVKLLMHFDFF